MIELIVPATAGALDARMEPAVNVVCLFADQRPAVKNNRVRGRLPSGVVALRPSPALRVGDVVSLRSLVPENHGQFVRLLRRCDGGNWEIEAVSGTLVLDNGDRARMAVATAGRLRRLPGLKGAQS